MDIMLGTVSSIVDSNKFVIKFTTKEVIENAIAYPIQNSDEPNIGDPIVLYQLETFYGYSYLWQKLRLKDFTRLKLGNSVINITEEGIDIQASSGNEVYIESSGDMTVLCRSNTTMHVNETADVTVVGDLNLNVGGNIKVTGCKSIEVPAGGTVNATGSGPFNAIKVCPYTSAPHCGSKIDY